MQKVLHSDPEVDPVPRLKKGAPPSYRRHSGGQACVSVRDRSGRRREILLGTYDSDESKAEYQRVLALLKAHHGYYPFDDDTDAPKAAGGLTVDEVVLAWWKYAERRYGADSLELKNYKHALRHLRTLFGTSPADEFSPKKFKAVRQRMVEAMQYQVRPADVPGAAPRWLGQDAVNLEENLALLKGKRWVKVEVLGSRQALSRKTLNRHLVRIRAVFSWAVGEELISPSVAQGLREVKGVQQGDREVKTNKPRRVAFWDDVLKVVPFCPAPVAAMLRLQWLTGMRTGEVRIMRTMDLDRGDPGCWTYRPGSDLPHGRHKNSWRQQERLVQLGPQCIELLGPWLREDAPEAFLFSPARWMAQREQERAMRRKSKRQPSQALGKRKKPNPKRKPGECYTKISYPQAVKRACERAGVVFHPYALRHGRKMDLARTVGSDAARAVLGQKSIDATEHYGEIDQAHAREVMMKLG
jgi:integrase